MQRAIRQMHHIYIMKRAYGRGEDVRPEEPDAENGVLQVLEQLPAQFHNRVGAAISGQDGRAVRTFERVFTVFARRFREEPAST